MGRIYEQVRNVNEKLRSFGGGRSGECAGGGFLVGGSVFGGRIICDFAADAELVDFEEFIDQAPFRVGAHFAEFGERVAIGEQGRGLVFLMINAHAHRQDHLGKAFPDRVKTEPGVDMVAAIALEIAVQFHPAFA